MRILSRYILKEFLSNLALGLIIFTFVLLLDHLFELMDMVLNKGAGVWTTLKLLFLLLPSSLTLTLPMSCLLASLLTFGKLSEHNEITAIRASGLGAWDYVRAPMITALLVVLFLIPFNTIWAPHAHAYFRQLYVQVLKRNPLVRIEEKTFVEIGDYHLFVERKGKRNGNMMGVSVYKIPTDGAPIRIFAEQGVASVDPEVGVTFTLKNGSIEQIDPSDPSKWLHTSFKTYQITIPVTKSSLASERALEEMDNKELRQEMKKLGQQQVPVPILACQIHLRWALAMTPVLFVALGVPLAIRVHRGGRSIGFGMSILIMVFYYVLLMGGVGAGQRGVWPPWLAVWLGNTVMFVLSVWLGWKFIKT